MTLSLVPFLLAVLAAGATPATHGEGGPVWTCEPAVVPACRPVTVTCSASVAGASAADGWSFTWDFGDGGGVHAGPQVRRVLPAGVVGYAVRWTARRGDVVRNEERVLPLDRASLASCSLAPTPRGAAWAAGPPPPAPPRPEGGLRVATISDSNGPYGAVLQGEDTAAAVRALTGQVHPDVVVHVGDMVAGQKRGLPADRVRAMWDGYFETVAAPFAAAGIPLLPVPGNHDATASRHLVDRAVYEAVWADRRPESPALAWVDAGDWPFRWAVRLRAVGPEGARGPDALLVALDAPDGRLARADVTWLAEVLAAADGATPRLVFAHVPPWQPTDRAYGALGRWDALAPVLRDGGVTALVSGHYEVFYPTVLDGVEIVLDGALARACAPRKDLATAAPGDTGGCRCRPLGGTDLCQGTSFVVFDFAAGAVARKFALHGPDFATVLPAALLPSQVNGHPIAPGWL